MREHLEASVLVVARREAGTAFPLAVSSGMHLLGTEPGTPVLTPVAGGTTVTASDGPRLDIWALEEE